MSRYFPLFVKLEGKKILVYGAGTIASRRISALLAFGCSLTVIAPEASKEVQSLADKEMLVWRQKEYQSGEISEEFSLVLAATNQKEINAQIGAECREKRIPVNVSSDRSLCDFYFPGLAVKDELVAGVTAGGADHKRVRVAAEKIRVALEEV